MAALAGMQWLGGWVLLVGREQVVRMEGSNDENEGCSQD